MVRKLEKALDKAFEAKINESESFATWFLSKTKFSGRPACLFWSRSINPWYRSKTTGKDSETDILLIFEEINSRKRFAIHIENKIDSKFTENQPELYHARAAEWQQKAKYRNYEDFEVVLIAPKTFYENNLEKSRIFHRYVPHEEIAEFVPEFGA